MKLIDAIFFWEDDKQSEYYGCVVITDDGGDCGFSNHVGNVFGGWSDQNDQQRAAGALALQSWMLRSGVPWESIHREFMKIEEYAAWVESETGPFREVYNFCQGGGA